MRSAAATLVPLPAPDGDYRALVSVLRAMTEVIDPDDILRVLADGLDPLVDAQWIGVVSHDGGDAFVLRATHRLHRTWTASQQPLADVSGPLSAWLLPEAPRVGRAAALQPLLPAGITQILSVPLPEGAGGTRAAARRTTRRGALILGRSGAAPFPTGAVPLLDVVAAQVGALFERFQWLDRFRAANRDAPARTTAAARPATAPKDSRWLSVDAAGQEALELLERAAATDLPLLLIGESGTGKELLAQLAHQRSARRDAPLVTLNVATLTADLAGSELFGHSTGAFTGAQHARRGLVEEAHGGTLFLDEVGDMPLNVQPWLLRVLEDGLVRPVGSNRPERVDVRVICATNSDLAAAVVSGRFREDLYHRIAGVEIRLPPLRERPADLRELARFFLRQHSGGRYTEVPDSWMDAFRQWHWPGNVRELRNAVRSAAMLSHGPEPESRFLPPAIRALLPSTSAPRTTAPLDIDGCTLAEAETALIRRALDACDGHRANAAARLGIPPRTLFDKLRRLGI